MHVKFSLNRRQCSTEHISCNRFQNFEQFLKEVQLYATKAKFSRKSVFTVRWQGGDGLLACRELCTFSPFNNRECGTTSLWASLACVVVGLSGQLREKQSSCIQQAKLLKTMKSVHLRHYLCFAYFIFWSLKLFHVSPIRDNLRCCSRHYFGPHNNTRKHVWSVKTSLHPIQAKTCMQTCTLVGPEMMLYAARSDRTAGARCHLHLHTAPCTRCI